jgi:hypothetical protein
MVDRKTAILWNKYAMIYTAIGKRIHIAGMI